MARSLADVDEASKQDIKTILLQYDRTLLVSDPRRCEPKKYVLLNFAELDLVRDLVLDLVRDFRWLLCT
jgi:hypothetical protein